MKLESVDSEKDHHGVRDHEHPEALGAPFPGTIVYLQFRHSPDKGQAGFREVDRAGAAVTRRGHRGGYRDQLPLQNCFFQQKSLLLGAQAHSLYMHMHMHIHTHIRVHIHIHIWAFLVTQMVKNLPAMQETQV